MKGKSTRSKLGRDVRAAKKANNEFVLRSRPERSGKRISISGSVDGRINLVGFYEKNLLEIQNDRKWDDNLCRSYDRVMCGHFGKLFESIPLEDMEEEDYLNLWEKYLQQNPTQTERDRAYMLIRYLARLAFDKGESDVIFWGDINEVLIEKAAKEGNGEASKAGKAQALGLRIARSLSLEAELKYLRAALELVATEGAALAGILIFLLDLRTSEACGLLYGDLVEIHPGYWGLKRRMLMDRLSREIVEGSKTENGYRLIPIPRFLVSLIRKRREYLMNSYSDSEIDGMPIACSGCSYTIPADQKLVNRVMSKLYRETDCDEALMMLAIRDFRNDHEIKEECEKSLIAYLGRHQMITEMVAVGMPERYIFSLAGHAQMDPDADIADLSNPDIFIEVSNYLNRRPAIWALDRSVQPDRIIFDGKKPLSKVIDTSVQVEFDSDGLFLVSFQEKEPLDKVKLSLPDGVEIIEELSLPPLNFPVTKTVSNTAFFRKIAETTLAHILKVENGDSSQEEPSAENGDTGSLADRRANERGLILTALEIEPKEEASLPDEQINVVQKPRPLAETRSEKSSFRFANNLTALYTRKEDGDVVALPASFLEICNRATKGKRVDSKQKTISILLYVPGLRFFALSRDGMLYPVPSKQELDKLLHAPEGQILADAFKTGVILLSWEESIPEQLMVCLTDRGNIVCFQMDSFRSIRAAGRKTVKLDSNQETIVSACICGKSEGVLLVSAKGKGLRLTPEDLPIRKTLDSAPVAGIKLAEDDRAVSCVPFGDGDLLFAKADGMIAAVKTNLMPHGRNTSGNQLVSGAQVVKAFSRPDAVAMLDSGGYLAIFRSEDFEAKNAGIKGVAAKKMKQGDVLIDACGLFA